MMRPLRPRVLLLLVVVLLAVVSMGPSGCEAKKKKRGKSGGGGGVTKESKPLPLHSPDQTREETLELETPKVGGGDDMGVGTR